MEFKGTKGPWVDFKTSTDLVCAYQFDSSIQDVGKKQFRIKIKTKLQRGYYYSALNEAVQYFDDFIYPELINPKEPADMIIISFNDNSDKIIDFFEGKIRLTGMFQTVRNSNRILCEYFRRDHLGRIEVLMPIETFEKIKTNEWFIKLMANASRLRTTPRTLLNVITYQGLRHVDNDLLIKEATEL